MIKHAGLWESLGTWQRGGGSAMNADSWGFRSAVPRGAIERDLLRRGAEDENEAQNVILINFEAITRMLHPAISKDYMCTKTAQHTDTAHAPRIGGASASRIEMINFAAIPVSLPPLPNLSRKW